MTDETADEGLRERLTRQGEDALGKLAQDVLENPVFNRALSRALDAREKAAQAQEVAMGALNLPSAADLERLTRRVRSVSQRIEGIEDGIDRVEQRIEAMGPEALDADRLERIEAQLDALTRELAAVRESVAPPAEGVPREQERLKVGDTSG
jgi:predicted  nucleic acid-binding Zn-ribbon protein